MEKKTISLCCYDTQKGQVFKVQGSEEWETKPRYWEGFLDKRAKNIVWELDAMNIPELEQVIKTKGIYNK